MHRLIRGSLIVLISLCILAPVADAKPHKSNPKKAAQDLGQMVADILYPMPPSLFTTLSVRYGWSVHQAPSTGLYTVGLTDIGGYYGDQILVKWSLNPKMDIGVDIGLGARYVQKTLGSSRVESQEISYRYIHAYVDYLLVKDLNFELRGFVGAGNVDGLLDKEQYSETGGDYLHYRRTGTVFSYRYGLEALYKINPVWVAGIQVSQFNGNVDEFLDHAEVVDEDAPELNLDGAWVSVFTGIDF